LKHARGVLLLGWLSACSSGGAKGDGSTTPHQDGSTAEVPGQVVTEIPVPVAGDVDILFMVDSSLSTQPLQTTLILAFPTFVNVLEALPGGLPNLHLAVVSADMGAGRFDAVDIPSCRHGGDRGIFRSMPRGTCATSGLNPGQTFISNVGGMPNYTGDLAAAFTCIAGLGDLGCGFEHQLASVLRALGADGSPAPAENAGFLRANATLAVVLLTDEDDCSAPADSDLFDPSSRLVSDPLGPLASYRCNEFGHLCGGQPPPRTPTGPTDLSGTCRSAENGRLLRIADVAARLKALKTDPSKVLVAAIAGDPSPYVVKLAPPQLKDDPHEWPYVEHSCTTTIHYADPGIRIKELVDSFAGNGTFQTACNDTLEPAVSRIAGEIGLALGPPCIEARVVAGPAHPACTVVDHVVNDMGMRINTPVPACVDNGGMAPCWEIASAASSFCHRGFRVDIRRAPGTGPRAADDGTTVTCQVCQANDTRPGCQ
jgi:hypothetical protein